MALWQGSAMNASEYKGYHELYMANNKGTTSIHVFFCIIFTVQCTLHSALKRRPSIASEYFTMILPLTLAHTVLANHIYALNVLIFAYNVFKYEWYKIFSPLSLSEKTIKDSKKEHEYISNEKSIIKCLKEKNVFSTKQIQAISCVRGLTYLITIYAILAVDFKAFRKDLRKTEQYGYSLMDTGVGLFTIMSGLVHKDLQNHSLKQIFKSNMKFILVLASLGTARFWTVKALDYHEHVTEYGVHWNFFFTVAMCKITSTVVLYISNQPFLFSILTWMVHEYILCSGIVAWVFSDAPRTNLFSANREGICSCLGYTALYLFAAHIKNVVSDKTLERYNVLLRLALGGPFLWLISEIFHVYRPTSRTLANSAYGLYLCGVILILIALFYFFEAISQNTGRYFQTPITLTAINQNGLIYFLVANLLTGALNLSMQTLFVPSVYAIAILNIYMIATLALMLYLKDKGIKI